MKKHILLLIIFASTFAKAQEVRVANIIHADIYSDSDRDDSVKHVTKVKKVMVTRTEIASGDVNKKEFWYDKGLYLKGIDSSEQYVITYINSYDNSSKIKSIKTIFKDYPVTKDSYNSVEETKYFYFNNRIEEHAYEEGTFERICEYHLKDGIIQEYIIYGPNKLFGQKNKIYLINTYFHVWNYIEGIKTSKDSFYEQEGITYVYDKNNKITSISDVRSKNLFTYKDNLLISSKYVTEKDTEEDFYEYDAYGNWIKKTETENGKTIYITTRIISYK